MFINVFLFETQITQINTDFIFIFNQKCIAKNDLSCFTTLPMTDYP